MGQAPIHLHDAFASAYPKREAQALAFDAEFGSASFERTKGLTYFSVAAEYFGAVIVGCYYDAPTKSRPTSAATFELTGDPGDPAMGGDCEVIEVWDHGREIGQSLTDSTVACMCAAVLAGRGVVL